MLNPTDAGNDFIHEIALATIHLEYMVSRDHRTIRIRRAVHNSGGRIEQIGWISKWQNDIRFIPVCRSVLLKTLSIEEVEEILDVMKTEGPELKNSAM